MMSQELKDRLREAKKRRRASCVLLKDIRPGDLAVLSDSAKETGLVPEPGQSVQWGYLYRGNPEQVEALKSVLPSTEKRIGSYDHRLGEPVTVARVAFPLKALRHILALAGVPKPDKYIRWWRREWAWTPEEEGRS